MTYRCTSLESYLSANHLETLNANRRFFNQLRIEEERLKSWTKGACEKCKTLVPTTMKIESVPFSNRKGKIDDILCAVCDQCGHIVSIPQQSMPRIREAIHAKKYSIEARLPRHLLDILLLAGDRFEIGNPECLKDPLVRYYIGLAGQRPKIEY